MLTYYTLIHFIRVTYIRPSSRRHLAHVEGGRTRRLCICAQRERAHVRQKGTYIIYDKLSEAGSVRYGELINKYRAPKLNGNIAHAQM